MRSQTQLIVRHKLQNQNLKINKIMQIKNRKKVLRTAFFIPTAAAGQRTAVLFFLQLLQGTEQQFFSSYSCCRAQNSCSFLPRAAAGHRKQLFFSSYSCWRAQNSCSFLPTAAAGHRTAVLFFLQLLQGTEQLFFSS